MYLCCRIRCCEEFQPAACREYVTRRQRLPACTTQGSMKFDVKDKGWRICSQANEEAAWKLPLQQALLVIGDDCGSSPTRHHDTT